MWKYRDMSSYLKAETHNVTNRCDTSPRQVVATNRFVWHLKIIVAATEFCRSVCMLLRQIAATKLKSTNEGASIIFPWSLRKPLKMATEHVDQNKQPEQSKVSSSSEWSATTTRMVIEFYKENRALWDIIKRLRTEHHFHFSLQKAADRNVRDYSIIVMFLY